MKFKTTLFLFILFLTLLIFIYFFEFKRKSVEDEEGKLVSFSSDAVHKIILKKENETITFQKNEQEDWLIIEPLKAKADKVEVNRLADDFSNLRIERVVEEEPHDLEKYEIPQKEIHLWLKDNDNPIKILIGMENPLDNTFFAKRADEMRIVIIPSHLKNLMDKTLFDFRQKDIFSFETDEVETIKLQAKKNQWEATKIEEEWFFTKPLRALAKENKISDLLYSFSSLKAKEFISEEKNREDEKKYGFDNPEYKITLNMPAKNQEITFFLQKKDDNLYATTSLSSKIITIEDSILPDLEKKAEELREDEVANFHSWEANKLYLRRDEFELAVSKSEDDLWHFEAPNEGTADQSKIQTFIRKIESLKATEFIDPPLSIKDYKLDNPQGEVKIWVKEDEKTMKEISILIGPEDEEAKQIVVKNARLDYLFRVDSGFLEEFPKNINDWKKSEEEEKKE